MEDSTISSSALYPHTYDILSENVLVDTAEFQLKIILKPTNNEIHNLHHNLHLAGHTIVSRWAITCIITFMAQVMCDD